MKPYGKMKSMKNRKKRQMDAMKKSGLTGSELGAGTGAMTDYDMENIMSQAKHNFIGKGAMTDKDMELLKKYAK